MFAVFLLRHPFIHLFMFLVSKANISFFLFLVFVVAFKFRGQINKKGKVILLHAMEAHGGEEI
jgi:hypothetical protein